jgi:anti-sigma B factor antagonist
MQPIVERVGDVAVVTVMADQLDASNSDDFRRDMTAVLADCHHVVLDLRRVRFVDSRGCGAIISCLKHVSGSKGDLKLCQVLPSVRTTFELVRLHRICEIFDNREQAVSAFGD